MTKKEIKTSDDEKKIKVSTVVYSLLIIAVVLIGIMSVLAFGTNTQIGANIKGGLSKVIPFPAAIVDLRHVVYVSDVQANLASVEKFYATQNFASEGLRIDFTTDDGKKRLMIKEREILDKMVEDQIIQILAQNQGITITDADAEKVVTQKLNEFGSADDVTKDLANSYGWNMEDFKQRVVVPSLYSEALAAKVASNDTSAAESKNKIMQAQKDLENGKDFSQVVRSYSEGSSKDKDGELGWVKKEQVVPELQTALFGSDKPTKNSVIESSIGYHIIDVENSKKVDGVDELQLRQVFISKNTFADWLDAQKKQMHVTVPLRDFIWDSTSGSIDFRDEKMRTFEKTGREKSQGDASIMY